MKIIFFDTFWLGFYTALVVLAKGDLHLRHLRHLKFLFFRQGSFTFSHTLPNVHLGSIEVTEAVLLTKCPI